MSSAIRNVALVIGASSGIGGAIATKFVKNGYTVYGTSRSIEQSHARLPGMAMRALDIREEGAIAALVGEVIAATGRIDVLINNAALVLQHREETVDGYEKVFAVNHLAPYLLTRLLLDRIVASAPARIVNVASDAHTFGAMEPDDYMSTRSYKPMKVYGRSKLANILFTVELAKRLEGTGVTANCLHPGFVSTSLARDNKFAAIALRLLRFLPFIKSPEDGAATTLRLATTDVGVTGEYFADGKVHATKDYAKDPVMATRLWDDSAALVGLS